MEQRKNRQSTIKYWIDTLLRKVRISQGEEKVGLARDYDEDMLDPELFLDDSFRAELFGYGEEDPDDVDLSSDDNDWQALLEDSVGCNHEELPSFAFVYPEVEENIVEKPDYDICGFEELKTYARATEDPEALYLVALRYPVDPNDPNYNQEYVQNPRLNEEMRLSYLKRAAAKGHDKAQTLLYLASKLSNSNSQSVM